MYDVVFNLILKNTKTEIEIISDGGSKANSIFFNFKLLPLIFKILLVNTIGKIKDDIISLIRTPNPNPAKPNVLAENKETINNIITRAEVMTEIENKLLIPSK